MKWLPLTLFLVGFETVNAGLNWPHVTVNIENGASSGIDVLDPSLSWSSSASALTCDFEVGCEVAMKPTLDVLSLPRSVWGRVSRDVAGWGLSSRVNVDVQSADGINVDVAAKNKESDIYLKLNTLGGRFKKLDIAKGVNVFGGRFVLNPRYYFKQSAPDFQIDYERGSTAVTLQASKKTQKVVISQEVMEGHRIIPTFSSNGDISLGWEKATPNGSITSTIKPNDSILVEWNDGQWTALIEAQLDGYSTHGVNVSIKRKVDIF